MLSPGATINTALETLDMQAPHPHYAIELRPLSFFRESEEIDRGASLRLAEQIQRMGHWTVPIPVDFDTGIVMDGNHRLNAARHLKLAAIPCIPLRYDDPRIAVECWNTGDRLRPDDIVRQILAGGTLPYKTTRHLFAPTLPTANIPLAVLGHPGQDSMA
jgi:hypothetical protein